MASAYGIVKNHGGIITVYSEVGRGTTFNIYLPVSEKEVVHEPPATERLLKGTETILLVDDEEIIIDVGKDLLENLGHKVFVADSGEHAIEILAELGEKINLVILDLVMPGLDGSKTFDRIRELLPDMPVLLSSGYPSNGQADEVLRKGCNGFIQKPFNLSELSLQIRKILDT